MLISELKVMHSRAGYYVGRSAEIDGIDMPYSRESEYFSTADEATEYLNSFLTGE